MIPSNVGALSIASGIVLDLAWGPRMTMNTRDRGPEGLWRKAALEVHNMGALVQLIEWHDQSVEYVIGGPVE